MDQIPGFATSPAAANLDNLFARVGALEGALANMGEFVKRISDRSILTLQGSTIAGVATGPTALQINQTWTSSGLIAGGLQVRIFASGAENASSSVLSLLGGVNGTTNLGFFTISGALSVPSTIQAGSGFITNSGNMIQTVAKSFIKCSADGQINLTNAAGTGFTGLTLGPESSSFPQLVASSGNVLIRHGDTSIGAGIINTGPLGYGPAGFNVGGAVIQATSKSTPVTLSTACGTITMNNAALLSLASASFTWTNTLIAATDVVIVNFGAVGAGAYIVNVQTLAGSATVTLTNITAGSLSDAVVLEFALIKAVAS
jgi:hypothetical protein